MRRDIGFILAGLGTFLIAMAVLLPTYIAGHVIKWPLNEYESTVLEGGNGAYFSTSKLSPVTGVTIQAVYTFKGNAAEGTSSTAVWNEFNYVHDVTNNALIQSTTRTFAFDRRTTQLVNCCGANVNGNTSIRQTGIAGYAFPIGTGKQTYQVFDATVGKPEAFVYSGTATVHGIQTYMFTENVPGTMFTTQTVPGSLVGLSVKSITLPEYYQNHVIYYVDPETGVPLNITEHEVRTLRSPSTGTQALLLFDANLAMTPASVNALVNSDNSRRNKIPLLETILPLAIGILGGVLLVVGVLLIRRGERDEVQSGPTPGPDLAAVREEPAPASGQAGLIPGMDGPAGEATAELPAAGRIAKPHTDDD